MKRKDLPLHHMLRPNANGKPNPPALFMLHGFGSNEQDLFSFAPELPEDLLVISLRAPYDLPPYGHAWYAINFEAPRGKWNDVDQAIKSRELLLKTIDEAIEKYGLDPDRISLLGFSQGSILSYALALSYPERIKSVIALSGYVDPEMLVPDYRDKDLSQLRVYGSHGQVDPVIPVAWAQQAADFINSLGIDHRYREFPVGHGVSPENLADFKAWMEGKY
ncbi:MAG: alpha/beta fold hydrolase [Robiginitalea sp.]